MKHLEAVHEGKKDHLCTMCEKRFYRKVDMDKHFALVHEKKNVFKEEISIT